MLIESLLLGLAYMLAPGPVLVETVRRSIAGGIRSTAAVQCGAFSAVVIYAVVFLFGAGHLLAIPGVKFGLGMLGAALLVYLGVSMAWDTRSIDRRMGVFQTQSNTNAARERIWRPFGVGVLLLLLSPYSLVFWFSVGNTTFNTSFGALSAFMLGSAIGCAIAALLAGQLGLARMQQFAIWVWIGCAVVLTTLGVQLGYGTLFAGGS